MVFGANNPRGYSVRTPGLQGSRILRPDSNGRLRQAAARAAGSDKRRLWAETVWEPAVGGLCGGHARAAAELPRGFGIAGLVRLGARSSGRDADHRQHPPAVAGEDAERHPVPDVTQPSHPEAGDAHPDRDGPERRFGADDLQHVPAAARRPPPCAGARNWSPGMIRGPSTGMARHSMSARPSPAFLSKSRSMPSKGCARVFPPLRPWRSWRRAAIRLLPAERRARASQAVACHERMPGLVPHPAVTPRLVTSAGFPLSTLPWGRGPGGFRPARR